MREKQKTVKGKTMSCYLVLIEISSSEYRTAEYFEIESLEDINMDDSVKHQVNCVSLDFKGLKSQRLYITQGDIYNGRGWAFFKKN